MGYPDKKPTLVQRNKPHHIFSEIAQAFTRKRVEMDRDYQRYYEIRHHVKFQDESTIPSRKHSIDKLSKHELLSEKYKDKIYQA